MFSRRAKLDCISSRNEFERPFRLHWACQKVSHRRRIQKSDGPREWQIDPRANILRRHKMRLEQLRNASRLPLRRHATAMLRLLRALLAALAIGSQRFRREIRSSLRGELIPNNSAIHEAEFHLLLERGSAW